MGVFQIALCLFDICDKVSFALRLIDLFVASCLRVNLHFFTVAPAF